MLNERINGIIFRSKAKWFSEGDRSSKYFFNLEKESLLIIETCLRIIDQNGDVITDMQQILEVQRQFYVDLYTENKEIKFTINKSDTWPTIPQSVQENKDNQLQINEFDVAISQMAKNKSPRE